MEKKAANNDTEVFMSLLLGDQYPKYVLKNGDAADDVSSEQASSDFKEMIKSPGHYDYLKIQRRMD